LEKNRTKYQGFENRLFEILKHGRTVLLLSYTIYIKKERKVVKPHKTKTHTHTHPSARVSVFQKACFDCPLKDGNTGRRGLENFKKSEFRKLEVSEILFYPIPADMTESPIGKPNFVLPNLDSVNHCTSKEISMEIKRYSLSPQT